MFTNQEKPGFWEQVTPGWHAIWGTRYFQVVRVLRIQEMENHVRWIALELQEMGKKDIWWVIARTIEFQVEVSIYRQIVSGTREEIIQTVPSLFGIPSEMPERFVELANASEIEWRERNRTLSYVWAHPPLFGKVDLLPPFGGTDDIIASVVKYGITPPEAEEYHFSEATVLEFGVPDDAGGLVKFLAGRLLTNPGEIEFVSQQS